MKVNKKIYIMILIGLYIFFISIFNVNAATYTATINYRDNQNNWIYDRINGNRYSRHALNTSGNTYYPFQNYGEGTLIFSFTYTTPQNNTAPLSYVGISSDYEFICDIGTTITYSDSQSQAVIVTASCPSNMTSGGLKYINIGRIASDNYLDIRFSEYATFVTRDNTSVNVDVHQQDVVNAINNSQQQTIQQIQNQTNTLNDIKNQDIDNDSKTAPDQTQYNTAKQQENNIIQSISNVSPNDITFSQDIQATNKIWETTTRFLQTNAKVMGLVISILSIGIIKLVMNR